MLSSEESPHLKTLYKHYKLCPWHEENDLYTVTSKGERKCVLGKWDFHKHKDT